MKRNICFFLTTFILAFLKSTAQDKIQNVKIIFDENIKISDITILYDDGIKTNKLNLNNINTNREVNINSLCLASYLKIIVLGLYKEEKYDNYEEFYLEQPFGEIYLYQNPNDTENNKYLFKLQNVLESKNLGAFAFNKIFEKTFDEFSKLREEINKSDISTIDSLRIKYNTKVIRFEEEKLEYIKNNNKLFFAQDLFLKNIPPLHNNKSESQLLNFYFQTFDSTFTNSQFGKRVLNEILDLELDDGTKAPNVFASDINGVKINLENYLGKYVLIDFWATWCKPCIQEIPTLKKLRTTINTERLEIISISQDSDKTKWTKYIKKNNLNWIHILDEDQKINNLFKVDALPKAFLIDKNGKIIYSTNGEVKNIFELIR